MPTVTDYTAIINGPTYWGTGSPGKPVFLTYSFSTSVQPYWTPSSAYTQNFLNSFQPLTDTQQALARLALSRWAEASGITFFEVPAGQGDLQFDRFNFNLLPNGNNADGFAMFANGPGENDLSGDVSIDTNSNEFTENVWLYMHEIGHALGLKHPLDNGGAGTNTNVLPDSLNNRGTTVMGERPPAPDLDPMNTQAISPMDVQAIQYLYGGPDSDGSQVANWSWDAANDVLTQAGGAGDETIRGVAVADMIHGGGGKDLIYGNAGNDQLFGDDGDDTLSGENGDDTLVGGAGVDTLISGLGNDGVDGGTGVDTLVLAAGKASYTITRTGSGVYTIARNGAFSTDTDTVTNVEYFRFTDQTMRLMPGSGTAVADFDAPATYMAAIRDFDGNNLTGQGTQVIDPATGGLVAGPAWDGVSGWSPAGSAHANSSGLQSQILFNNLIGRFAELTTETDGQVYFDNFGDGGDTRIVGIYIDPEVTAGHAVQGGPDDSQRRFQNDLFIGNIKSVVASGDFNVDGLSEIYFSLADGTAYLHALMWADGNIQYANYQSAQQVQDYFNANNVSAGTWAGWLHEEPPQVFAAPGAMAPPLLGQSNTALAGVAV